ncbi:transmembrane protein 25 isoform X2 [Brienomyrus brachyistius]|uniref:transmembrane protein 25 isoform X2 n=1 Tax=Brienomyrus brachyistius TaxID=42636 RepID=UPI0020B4385B|nr:transmembrane protein 25 isoform X2 [Brienomyrus brachyistius]
MLLLGQNRGPTLAVLFLYTWAYFPADAIELTPKIDGQMHSALTLKENATHRFNCQSEGSSTGHPHLLTWYLNGERQKHPEGDTVEQLVATSHGGPRAPQVGSTQTSTFTLHARKWDRELVCVASHPRTGISYNATVVLNVQYQPEILRVNAHYSETSDPGLSLVLFALVRSNPPATITWVDQAGRPVANTSDFFILDSHSYPWLTNHTLRVSPSSLTGNVSFNASNSLGSAQSNLTLAEFLQSRVEVPLLGIVTGGAVGFVTLLILTLLLFFLMHKNKGKKIDEPVEMTIRKSSESDQMQLDHVILPRENMSLPSNLQLNEHSALCKGMGDSSAGPMQKQADDDGCDLLAAYAAKGFSRFPMVGYIYKVNSVSSDEVWL